MGCVPPVRILERQSKRIGAPRDGNQVHVIGHDAIADEREPMQAGIMPEQIQVNEALGVGCQNVLAGVPALSDMVRDIDSDHASQASHDSQK